MSSGVCLGFLMYLLFDICVIDVLLDFSIAGCVCVCVYYLVVSVACFDSKYRFTAIEFLM